MATVDIAEIEAAAAALRGAIVRTPCTRSITLSEITGADVWCKFENQQFTASFKERGARWFLLALDDTRRRHGVVAASAGNHAQGVAHHARLLGIDATIVMPASTPFAKVTRTEMEGATVVVDGADFGAAHEHAQRLATETGATFVPAFDDPRVIAGQGTVALEVLEQVEGVDDIVVPVGGGGLIAGIATAIAERAPATRVVGVQSDTNATFAAAWRGGERAASTPPSRATTIAEGIAVATPGHLTLAIAREAVAEMLVVDEEAIEAAMALYVEVEKTVVEGAGAASLAALLAHPDQFAGRRVVVIVSGGNVDLRVISSVMMRALARSGRLVRFRCRIPDLPGQLARVAEIIGDARGNIVDVEHHRDRPGVAVRDTILEVSVETRDAEHAATIAAALEAAGFPSVAAL